ncbi:hypothetical protein GW750_00615 [bacterium]|nr:hypothetical protein [bacterium]
MKAEIADTITIGTILFGILFQITSGNITKNVNKSKLEEIPYIRVFLAYVIFQKKSKFLLIRYTHARGPHITEANPTRPIVYIFFFCFFSIRLLFSIIE